MAKMVPCVGCGALVNATPGPTHRYMISAPVCWAMYGELNVVLSTSAAAEYVSGALMHMRFNTLANRTPRQLNPWPATF
jgi:hypothetical protein